MWTVMSGNGKLLSTSPGTQLLQYDFGDASAAPVVLRAEFDARLKPDELHRLLVSYKGDASWHHVDAELRLGDRGYESEQTTYIAQHRGASLLLQPPTFQDQSLSPHNWVSLKHVTTIRSDEPTRAALTLTIRPSSTLRAIWGKFERNYARAFRSVPFWVYVRNSLIVVVLSLAGALFSSAFVGYAFARLNWPGRSVAFGLLLATMMLPAQVTMIPTFLIWRALGWYNTLNPLWVGAWFGNAFFIFLMVQHMRTIPRELDEAARIDGLSALQTWWYIIVPQVKPTLAAIAILTFMGAWNEFMGPLIMLRDQAKFPLSLGLFALRLDAGADWPLIMAGNLLMTLPVIVIFFLFQRYFIEGVTVTGMKG
jgi:ABC-type glycerol-3-phosphate transport system permease component